MLSGDLVPPSDYASLGDRALKRALYKKMCGAETPDFVTHLLDLFDKIHCYS
jgi:hypothetical protein